MLTKLAVWWLCRQLKKDKMFWYGYQSNIAMTISDNLMNAGYATSFETAKERHEFCNKCANDFLMLLTGVKNHPTKP